MHYPQSNRHKREVININQATHLFKKPQLQLSNHLFESMKTSQELKTRQQKPRTIRKRHN